MKKTGFIIAGLILVLSHGFAQLQHLKNGQTVAEHPRILFLKGDENRIQKNIDTDKNWAKIHQTILNECEKMIKLKPLERIQIGRRLLDKSREALRRIFYLSYAYRMTREPKYLQRAETELLTVSRFSDWNPTHFLDVGEMTMAVAIGYDWLYHDLQKTTLPILKEAILTKGIEPSLDKKYNNWLKVTNNWNQVCNAGMTYGALAIYEDKPSLALQIIDRAISSIKLPMEDYNPDGAYPEGVAYWGYGTSFNVLFLSALQGALGSEFGLSDGRGFLNTGSYVQNMIGSSGKTFNYSDAGNGSGNVNPTLFWFANRTKNASLLYGSKKLLEIGKATMGTDRILPAAMIWGKDVSFDEVSAPKQLVWTGQGKNPVTLMRTSWTDSNAIYVGLKAGTPSASHAHMDVGSFVMDALGERWSMDFGMQEYESLESKGVKLWGREQNAQRWQVYRYNNMAHSTLTFDGQLQRVEGYAKIESTTDKPDFMASTTNLTQMYDTSIAAASRGVAIVNQQYVVVKDEIKASNKPTTVRWLMVTPAEVAIEPNGMATLTQKGKKLQMQVVSPTNVTIKTWPTTPTHDYDAPNPGSVLVGFETTIAANTNCNLEVLLVPEGATVDKKSKTKPLKKWK
jgi:Heparinase II/III-like protein